MRAVLALSLLAGLAAAQSATADLVADRESVAPGGTVAVGVRFRLGPHCHVYWKNPGDSGQEPRIRWRLPEGVTASALAWPAPHRIPTPPFMTFGYEGEVTLASEISVPKGHAAATLLVLADVEWLVCDANGCVPGEAKLSLEIPVRPGEAARREIATGLPVAPTGPITARYDRKRIVLTAPGAPSFFFPAEQGVLEAVEPQPRDGGALTLVPSKNLKEPVRVLRGVLTFESGPAWEVEVPVEPEGGSGTRLIVGLGVAAAVVLLAAYMLYANRKEKTA